MSVRAASGGLCCVSGWCRGRDGRSDVIAIASHSFDKFIVLDRPSREVRHTIMGLPSKRPSTFAFE